MSIIKPILCCTLAILYFATLDAQNSFLKTKANAKVIKQKHSRFIQLSETPIQNLAHFTNMFNIPVARIDCTIPISERIWTMMRKLLMLSPIEFYNRLNFSCWGHPISIPKPILPFFYSFLNNYTSYNTDQ